MLARQDATLRSNIVAISTEVSLIVKVGGGGGSDPEKKPKHKSFTQIQGCTETTGGKINNKQT